MEEGMVLSVVRPTLPPHAQQGGENVVNRSGEHVRRGRFGGTDMEFGSSVC